MLTLALGAVGTDHGPRGAGAGAADLGLAIGALLSWVNFRWLKGSVQAFGQAATSAGQAAASSPPAETEGAAAAPQRPCATCTRAKKAAYFQFLGALCFVWRLRRCVCYSDSHFAARRCGFPGIICRGCECGRGTGVSTPFARGAAKHPGALTESFRTNGREHTDVRQIG